MTTQEQIEAFFLNHNDPYFEMIQNADTEPEAFDIALSELQKISNHVEPHTLLVAVQNIRNHA